MSPSSADYWDIVDRPGTTDVVLSWSAGSQVQRIPLQRHFRPWLATACNQAVVEQRRLGMWRPPRHSAGPFRPSGHRADPQWCQSASIDYDWRPGTLSPAKSARAKAAGSSKSFCHARSTTTRRRRSFVRDQCWMLQPALPGNLHSRHRAICHSFCLGLGRCLPISKRHRVHGEPAGVARSTGSRDHPVPPLCGGCRRRCTVLLAGNVCRGSRAAEARSAAVRHRTSISGRSIRRSRSSDSLDRRDASSLTFAPRRPPPAPGS